MNANTADLFISYNNEECAWVERVIGALEGELEVLENGRLRPFRCFVYVQDIAVGEDWHETMLAHALSAHRFLFVMSARALASQWCQLELHERINNRPHWADTLLFANRMDGSEAEKASTWILTRFRRWLDVTDARPFETQMDELAGWLCGKNEYEAFQIIRQSDKRRIFGAPKALEEAFRRFVSCVGIVMDERCDRPLGYAWLNEGRQFLCDYETARASHEGSPGRALRLVWRDELSDAGGSLIIARADVPQRWNEAGKLYVSLNAPLPSRPFFGSGLEYFSENNLGTLVLEPGTKTSREFCLVPRRAALSSWFQPAGINVTMEAGEILLSGAPLFDAWGSFAGCVTRDVNGASVALPSEIFRSPFVRT
jgi:hypothetical protein